MSPAAGIAMVGMACRYPDIESPGRLWETVLGRRRAFRRLPEQRLSNAYLGSADDPDRTYSTHAGLLRGWVFDRERFGVPGALHRAVDHTHWLALETAADALLDAGFPEGRHLDRDRVGVLIGNTMTGEFSRAAQLRLRWPFVRRAAEAALGGAGISGESAERALGLLGDLIREPFPVPGDESLAGALSNTIAGRICNHFDFHGAGYTVDGACASSLLSVMTASRALLDGELDFALAGGVDLSLDPFELVGFARTGALAVDEMRVYDAEPTGFLPGEGCGVVALMRLEDAERAGLRIYAVLAGWGTSSDGTGGLTRPDRYGQSLAMARAYRMAEIDPQTVELVEGHGTGTRVGDEVELAALCTSRGDGAARAALGSIKANIGHTKAAAGVAGLIKAALAIHHRVLPPTTGVESPHELLRRPTTPLRVLAEPEPWCSTTPFAAVSAMGFGGVNAHLVLRGQPSRAVTELPARVVALSRRQPRHEILLIDATTSVELGDRLAAVAEFAPRLSAAELHDLAASEHAARRSPGTVRCALIADTPDRLRLAASDARDRLATWDGGLVLIESAGVVLASGPAPRIGLLFPGQAAPVRASLGRYADGLSVPTATGVDLVDGANDTAVAQPAIVRQSLAALAWLDACGCRPVAATGHSLGEISALVWAGALDAAAGLDLAVVRGRLMAEQGRPGTVMAAIGAGPARAALLAEGMDVEVTGFNGPEQSSVGGFAEDVEKLVARAREQGVPATLLPVSHAFHSAAMDDVVEPLRAELARVDVTPPNRPVFSTVTGRALSANTDLRALLANQITRPVRFAEALTGLAERCDVLVEVGPGTTLTDLARSSLPGLTVFSLDSGDPRRHTLATAALAASGAGDLGAWFAGRAYRPFDIDAPITLLANPCETTLPGLSDADRIPEPVAAAPVARPEPHAEPDADPLQTVREYLSRELELPLAGIRPESTLLGDLHLNSLRVVQVVAATSAVLARRPPKAGLSVVDTTVADIAELLAAQPSAAEKPADAVPAGLTDWLRAFEHHWAPFDPVDDSPIGGEWTVDAPAGHWLHSARLPGRSGESGLAVLLTDPQTEETARVLRLIADRRPQRLLLVHRGHPTAAAVGRSTAVEIEGCAVTVVDTAGGTVDSRLIANSGYRELRVDRDGRAEHVATRVRALGKGADLPLGPGDVCLVTGGADGITGECGIALARRTGCTLVVIGRSSADSPRVVAARSAMADRVPAHYVQGDITDPEDVAVAIAAASAFGTVRGLLHGVGVNEPQSMSAVTTESLRLITEPKVNGLRLLLAAVPYLRLVVGFGSIIGRGGLVGQAEYCVANDWLRVELERRAAEMPACRIHLLEWSLWKGIGMGERMGVVDDLAARGISPITVHDGPAILLDVLADAAAPVTLLLTGRFPAGPTLAAAGPEPEPLRFTENVRVHTAGVEAVAEVALSLGDDPYLDDHRLDEVPVLPAVIGLEAMAQAADVVTPGWKARQFVDIDLRNPITVEQRGVRGLRVLALAERDRGIRVAVRDDTDGFDTDHFTATVREAGAAEPGKGPSLRPASIVDETEVHPFYDSVLFHRGLFRRVIGYQRLSAFEVRAKIRSDPDAIWFSAFHHQGLLLGDPGAHDAVLHVLLACVPHRRALPVGADRFTVWQTPCGVLDVHAVERAHTADDYVFDIEVVDSAGELVARWDALRLRAVGPAPRDRPLRTSLVGPLLSRRLIELGVAQQVELVMTSADETDDFGDTWTANGHGHVLLARADQPVGAVWGPARHVPAVRSDAEVIASVTSKLDEPVGIAACRVVTARAALTRLGMARSKRLDVDEVTDDGLVVLSCTQVSVVVARLSVVGLGDAVFAIAVERT